MLIPRIQAERSLVPNIVGGLLYRLGMYLRDYDEKTRGVLRECVLRLFVESVC